MDPETFFAFADYIMAQTGLDEEQASAFAAAIGDTPDQTADGSWTATIDGKTITIPPFRAPLERFECILDRTADQL